MRTQGIGIVSFRFSRKSCFIAIFTKMYFFHKHAAQVQPATLTPTAPITTTTSTTTKGYQTGNTTPRFILNFTELHACISVQNS